MTEKLLDTYNIVVGGIIAVLSAVFGIYWYVFLAYFVTNILDWITGWAASTKENKTSSKKGLKGIIKKVGYWIIIAVAFLVSDVFVMLGNDILKIDLSFLLMIGWFTLANLLINEIRSIIENLLRMGYKVPGVLTKGLQVTADLINQEGEKSE